MDAFEEAQLAPLRRNFPVNVGDAEGFLEILKKTRQVQTSKAALEALGEKAKEPSPGILDRAFGMEKGIFTAPLRAVTGFLASAGGYPDERILRYNPIEAALRSAAGEFAVTGGDIIKIQDDDNFATRLGKYAGAFALDVGLDPISYLGPVGAFNKVRLAEMAVNQSDTILASTLKVASRYGVDETKLVDDLFNRSRQAVVARAESEAGILGSKAADSTLASLGATGGFDTISQAAKSRVAAQELGNLVGESLIVGGRGLLKKDLVKLVGSDQAATALFRELPREIAGGFFLKNPISGRPIARLGGGAGAVFPGSQTLSTLRFRLSAGGIGRWLGRYLDGESGRLLSEVKLGLRKAPEGGPLMRDTFADYVNYKKMLAASKADVGRMTNKARAVILSVPARRMAMEEGDRPQFDQALFRYFDNRNLLPDDDAPRAVVEGFKAAEELDALIREAREEMVAAGVDIGDLGPRYRNLVITQEERDRLAAEGIGVSRATGRADYNPLAERISFTFYHPDPEVRALLGSDMAGAPGAGYLSPKAANDAVEKQLGRRPFVEDPILIATEFTHIAARMVAARRFVRAGISSGILMKFPAETRPIVDGRRAAALISALADVNPQARAKAEELSAAVRRQVAEVASDARIQQVQADLEAARNQALKEYNEAREAVEAARVTMVEANRAVADASDMTANTFARMASVADAGIGQTGIDEMARVARNNRNRLNTARQSLDELNAEIDRSRELVEVADQIGDPEDLALAEAARDRAEELAQAKAAKVEREFLSLEQAQAALDEAQAFRSRFLVNATGEQLALFGRYENALRVQRQAAENLAQARAARDTARNVHVAARKNMAFSHARKVDAYVEAYLSAMRQLRLTLQEMPSKANRTEAQKALVKELQAEVKNSMAALRKVVGYSKNYTGTNAGIEYAKTIIEMSKKLADDEVRAAMMLADTERLGALIEHYAKDPANRDLMMNLIGDMVSVYGNIRQNLTAEDLAKLTDVQRKALTVKPSKLTRGKRQPSKAAAQVTSKDGVRKVGAGKGAGQGVPPASLADVYAPNGVAGLLEDYYTRTQDPKEWQKWLNGVYDPLFATWKSAVTIGRGPAYVMLNTVGGLANNFLGRVSGKSHVQAAQVLAGVSEITNQLYKEQPTASFATLLPELERRLTARFGTAKIHGLSLADLYVELLERGGHFTTETYFQYTELMRFGINMEEPFRRSGRQFIAEETAEGAPAAIQKLAGVAMNNWYMRMMSNAAQTSEMFIRFAAFIDGWGRFQNLDTAMNFSMMLHFDYNDLSNAERSIRRLAPFYTWSRRNIPLQFRMVFMAPDQMSKMYKANENFEKAFGRDEEQGWMDEFLPDYIKDNGGFLLRHTVGGNHLAVVPKLPMNDLDRQLGVHEVFGIPVIVLPKREELQQMAGPVIKTPMELITNRNFQYGYEYESTTEALTAQAKALVPQLRLGQQILSQFGVTDQERQASNLYSILLGAPYSMNTFTERQLRGGMFRRSIELNDQLREAAAEANVDIEWLRKKVKDGTPLPTLMMMIKAGLGDPERVERERSQNRPRQNVAQYLSTVRALEEGRSPYLGY